MLWLLLAFVVAPVVELYVIIEVAGAIGWLPTLAFIVVSSLVGAWLTKVEGLGVLRRMRRSVDAGQLPADEAIDGLLVSLGGVLMFVPGFLSTFVGLALLAPPVRGLVRPLVRNRIRRRVERSQARVVTYSVGLGPDPFGGGGVPGGPDGWFGPGTGGPIDVDSHLWVDPERPGATDAGGPGRPRPELER